MLLLLNFNSIILLFTLTINFGLGLYIYLKDRKNEINRIFSLLLFLIGSWAASFLFFLNSTDPEWVLFWRRMTPVGSGLVAGYFLYFSLIFPKIEKPLEGRLKLLILLPGFIFGLLSVFTPYMIKLFVIKDAGFPFLGRAVFGPLYFLYAIYLLSFFSFSLYNLFYKYVKSSGRERLQIFYVLFGMALSVVLGIIVSLIMPLFGASQYFTLGPSFALVLACFIAYAIMRHRLLNIEDFLSRGMFFLVPSIALAGTLALILTSSLKYLFPFYTCLGNLALGFFVYFVNRKNKINVSFALITLLVVLWTVSILLYSEAGELPQAYFWSRIAAAVSAYIPALFLYFAHVFPKEDEPVKTFQAVSWLFTATFISLFSLSNIIVKEAVASAGGFHFLPGLGFVFYNIYFVGFFAFALYELLRKYYRYTGTHKLQVGYVFLGFFSGSIFPIMTNLILPIMGWSGLAGIGPFFTIIAISFISYAIVKHRLMSIEVVIQRSTVYAVATVLIMTIYALAVIISETVFRKIMGYTSLAITAGAALMIAVAYQPLVRSFQNLTDRLFFRGRYDYQKTLRQISHRIASVIQLEELSKLIVSSFIDTMKVSEISFMLLEKEQEHFNSVSLSLPRYKKIEIDVSSPIISWLTSTKDIWVRDEIEEEPGHQEVRDEMDRLGISIWVPIISKDALIGIIALGNKLSGDVFTTEDIGLLGTLASQTAVALDNARLYDEVVNMKEYNEKILQSMVSGVLTVDTKARIITYNYMAEKITGRKMSEVLGKSCEEAWGKRGMITNVVEGTLNRGKLYVNFEANLASPERGLVPVAFSSTVLLDAHGKKMGALISIQDLTEVKELEGKVRQADKLSALATMAAGMAHEIKNPLSSMKVLSQLLPIKIDDPEFRRKLGEIFPREIDRIDRIVESLLGFARATAMNFELTDIKDILEDNLKYFADKAKDSEVKIVRDYQEVPLIEVDRGQISQVLSNLMLNAIQAMRGGGQLTVSLKPGKTVEGVVRDIKVQVSDTGHGIAEETLKKLFDPFYTTKYGGTGLGLTISHSIVDGHKGYIGVESKLGKGTSFTITLPVGQGLV